MGKKILVVDDDPGVQLFNTTVVEEAGHMALIANNGEEGLAMVKSASPDLILMDVLMPRQSGVKMYRALKTDPAYRDIPIIVLTGISKRSFLKSQQALTQFGGEAVPEPEVYLEKPVSAETLMDRIQKFLGK